MVPTVGKGVLNNIYIPCLCRDSNPQSPARRPSHYTGYASMAPKSIFIATQFHFRFGH